MKLNKILPWIVVLLLLGSTTFSITRNKPEDKVVLYHHMIETGRQIYEIDLDDDKGNYQGNTLRVKLFGDTEDIGVTGLAIWGFDPNYYVVLNAEPNSLLIYDPNDPNHVADPNIVTRLSGSFRMGKTWEPGHHEIGIQVFDVYDHNDCKWLIVDVEDITPPSVGGCSLVQ